MKTTAPSLPKSLPKALAARVEFWDDERNADDGIIVTLTGWAFEPGRNPCHVHGFDTPAEAIRGIRAAEPCACLVCLAAVFEKDFTLAAKIALLAAVERLSNEEVEDLGEGLRSTISTAYNTETAQLRSPR